MIVPIRCFSCGRPIAQDWDEYVKKIREGKKPKDILDALGYERYCCRRMFLSHPLDKEGKEIIDEVMLYKKF